MYSFGLFDVVNNEMIGVVTYGAPPCPTEQEHWNDYNFVELNRLCIIRCMKKNVLSFFVSSSLKMLPENSVVISYADKDQNHSGYIYQATNWLYTGIGSINTKSYVMTDGTTRHSRHKHLIDMNKVKNIDSSIGKHRYYYFIGNKTLKKSFMKDFNKYRKILSYPKDEPKHYNITNNISLQKDLNSFI